MKTDKQKTKEIEEFYKDAFCANSVKLLETTKGFEIGGIVEIDTGDKRGIIHIAALSKAIENE